MVSGWHWSSKWHGKVQTVIQDGGQSQKHWHEHPWRPKNMLQWTLSTISFAPHTTYAFLHNLALKPHHLPKHKYLNSGSTSKSLHLFAHPTCTTLVLLFTVTHTHTHFQLGSIQHSAITCIIYTKTCTVQPSGSVCCCFCEEASTAGHALLYTTVTNRLPAFVFRACGDRQARRIFYSPCRLIC